MPNWRTWGVVSVACMAVLVCSSLHASDAEIARLLQEAGLRPVEPPSAAEDVALPDLSGAVVSLSEFSGSWILLTFWATWCGPCVHEMPSLEALHRELSGKGFLVVGVSVDSPGAPVGEFAERHELSFPLLLDQGKTAAQLYHASSIPLSYLIDPAGRIVGVSLGARDWRRDQGLLEAVMEAGASRSVELAWSRRAVPVALPVSLVPPTAEVALGKASPQVGETFPLDIRVRWDGDLEDYILKPPKVSLPDGVEQVSLSGSSSSETGAQIVTYRAVLRGLEAGDYALGPVELRYTPRFEQSPVSARVEGPRVQVLAPVSPFSGVGLVMTGALGAVGLVALVLIRRRRRGGDNESPVDELTRLQGVLDGAKRSRMDGDAASCVESLLEVCSTLGEEDETSEALSAQLRELLERVRFGGARPAVSELDRLERQVELRVRSLSPHPEDKRLDRVRYVADEAELSGR